MSIWLGTQFTQRYNYVADKMLRIVFYLSGFWYRRLSGTYFISIQSPLLIDLSMEDCYSLMIFFLNAEEVFSTIGSYTVTRNILCEVLFMHAFQNENITGIYLVEDRKYLFRLIGEFLSKKICCKWSKGKYMCFDNF